MSRPKHVGDALRMFRDYLDLTLGEAAKMFGVEVSQLSAWELARTEREPCKLCQEGQLEIGALHNANAELDKRNAVLEHQLLLHPEGKCTCAGEGQCNWCKKSGAEDIASALATALEEMMAAATWVPARFGYEIVLDRRDKARMEGLLTRTRSLSK